MMRKVFDMRKTGPVTKTGINAGGMKRLTRPLTEKLTGWSRNGVALIAVAMLAIVPAGAQDVESFDPDEAYEAAQNTVQSQVPQQANDAIDADLVDPTLRDAASAAPQMPVDAQDVPTSVPGQPGFDDEFSEYTGAQDPVQPGDPVPEWSNPAPGEQVASVEADTGTYGEDDLIGAAEGVFGKGAQGLAGLIEDLLREQGEPNGYIVGREAGGAFIFGARYGSGTLHHKIEGERKVYWTGPSLGIDAGANAGNTFVLVYNLFDSEDIFRRYPAGEGQAYFVGGMHASYMRRGDVVLIPIRVGAGLRLGINAGYMRFSKKHRWLPF